MKLLIKQKDAQSPLHQRVRARLPAPWRIELADADDTPAFARALEDADAIISMNWSTAPPAPRLKLLHLPGAGTDAIDFDAVPPTAAVCNAYGHEVSIAEYVMATLLEMTIGVRHMDAALRRNHWRGWWRVGPLHEHVHGKTIGIVGYGRIGREVARRARAFGMRVIACSRTAKGADEFVERVDDMRAFDTLLRESDFILVGLPLDEHSRGLFDARAFALMKPSAVIINPSRGAVIDEEALYRALSERRIGGAVIDVWYQYPTASASEGAPSRFAFHELDNIIMTPHASAWTAHQIEQRCATIIDNLNRLARGEALVNVVHAPRAAAAK
jgi:phosphoglycerate dehydrogenase-like enzyme